jgi:hypothetical protein
MKLSYKPLTINECDQFIDLLKSRPHVFNGYHDPEWFKTILTAVPKWFKNPLYFLPSIWADGDLIATIILKESANSPSWAWGHWVTKIGSPALMYTTDGVNIFREADRQIFDEMEVNRNLNRMMLSYRYEDQVGDRLKNAGMSDRMFAWMSRNNYRVARYKFYTDCTVEANKEAKYTYQRELLGNRTWPFKTAVRIGFLPEQI